MKIVVLSIVFNIIQQMLLVQVLSLFALLSLVFADAQTNATQTTYIEATGCFFNYHSLNGSFSFIDCDSPMGNTNNWYLCLTRCCVNMKSIDYGKSSLSAITWCKNNTVESSSSLAIIIMGLLIGAFALVVILCFCLVSCKIVGAFHLRNRLVLNIQVANEVEWPQQKQINNNNIQALLWSKNASEVLPLKKIETPCSICLEEDTTAELICQHQYHPGCIGRWFYKSDGCPCCRHESIKGAKIYCGGCRWRYIVATKNFLTAFSEHLELLCQECMRKKRQLQEALVSKNSAGILNNEGSHQHLFEVETFVFKSQQI